jgi:hypothetical protein
MSSKKKHSGSNQMILQRQPNPVVQQLAVQHAQQEKTVSSLLDAMVDGREYASILDCAPNNMDFASEIRRALKAISDIRKRPVICYVANMVNNNVKSQTGIDTTDDLPFLEMLRNVDAAEKELDIILVTPGGSAERVSHYVNQIRKRFDKVGFILPFLAMSAGTIFCLSGDEIIMDENACIGPIDPQVPSKDGRFVPAQSILTLLDDIQVRGQDALQKGLQPNWTDLQILRNLDPKEIGNATNASNYSIALVTSYLEEYKFRDWHTHSSNGTAVTDADRKQRALDIAKQLCDHSIWKTHSRGITRDVAENVCRLKIIHPEDVDELNSAIRRFWALLYWMFERQPIYKLFISDNYSLFRSEMTQVIQFPPQPI